MTNDMLVGSMAAMKKAVADIEAICCGIDGTGTEERLRVVQVALRKAIGAVPELRKSKSK
jgi:hypothetical protein